MEFRAEAIVLTVPLTAAAIAIGDRGAWPAAAGGLSVWLRVSDAGPAVEAAKRAVLRTVLLPVMRRHIASVDPALLEALAEPMHALGEAAVLGLAGVHLLRQGPPAQRIRGCELLVSGLAASGLEAHGAGLLRALIAEDHDGGVRAAAATALGQLGAHGAAAIPALIELFVEPDLELKLATAHALARLAPFGWGALPALRSVVARSPARLQRAGEATIRAIEAASVELGAERPPPVAPSEPGALVELCQTTRVALLAGVRARGAEDAVQAPVATPVIPSPPYHAGAEIDVLRRGREWVIQALDLFVAELADGHPDALAALGAVSDAYAPCDPDFAAQCADRARHSAFSR